MKVIEKKQQIITILAKLAEYYGKPLKPSQLEMYAEDLVDFDIENLYEAVKQYRRNEKNNFFPYPSQLISIIEGPSRISAEARATDSASKIIGAVRAIGPYRPDWAEKEIGDLGWEVVLRLGGWPGVCEMLSNENAATLQAQFRGIAKSIIETRSALGQDAPALRKVSSTTGGLQNIAFDKDLFDLEKNSKG